MPAFVQGPSYLQTRLLQGLRAITHWEDLAALEKYPGVNVSRGVKFIDEGNIITSAGIASGITMSLYLVARLISQQLARQTASQMEFPYEGSFS